MSESAKNSKSLGTPLLQDNPQDTAEKGIIKVFSWHNISVKAKGSQKIILHNESGKVMPGELVALVGASGAGKTTLLNTLAQKLKPNEVRLEGKIKYDLRDPRKLRQLKLSSSYLRQDDIFHTNLTPREAMTFAMDLQSSQSTSIKKERMEEIFKQLNLTGCADTRIGNFEFKGLSGGEKRRLSLALEMINDPEVLFADEPTSGLDSFSACLIVGLLKQHAQ